MRVFQPTFQHRSYTPCLYAVLHEKLCYEGHASSAVFFPGVQLLTVATYVQKLQDGTAWIDNWKARKLLGYPRYTDQLGCTVRHSQFSDWATGLSWLKGCIADGRSAILSGTTFYLPYSPDFERPEYIHSYPNPLFGIVDHWLLAYGLEVEQVLVYDPVPHRYLGSVPTALFEKYWRGNRAIPELALIPGVEKLGVYGVLEVIPPADYGWESIKQFILRAVRTACEEYIAGGYQEDVGEMNWWGQAADEQLVSGMLNSVDCADLDSLPMYSDCVFEMRFSRYFLRDILQEVAAQLDGSFDVYLNRYNLIIQEWEKASNIFKISLARQKNIQAAILRVCVSLEKAIAAEMQLRDEVRSRLAAFPPLAKENG